MKIKVTDILSDQSAMHVKFNSPVGNGIALWVGIEPKIGEYVDVELDLDEIFLWNENIVPTSDKTSSINTREQFTYIIAELIQATDEEYVALKFGDSIILVELGGALPQRSGYVEIKTNTLRLYPTNI